MPHESISKLISFFNSNNIAVKLYSRSSNISMLPNVNTFTKVFLKYCKKTNPNGKSTMALMNTLLYFGENYF